ncbi:ketopantoate reductase family protein [Actinomyces lilanjuaniae]|nr:2-dehydropantoate 2-reductase N-terminal domain-containing protein [Actinomyces lilanjuaniae]
MTTRKHQYPHRSMDVLVIGLGVIGTTYGYLFHKAGHDVEHLVRGSSPRAGTTSLEVDLLDGRRAPRGTASRDSYEVRPRTHERYDLIVVSVPYKDVATVMQDLGTLGVEGPVLLCGGFWGERSELEELTSGRGTVLGYPVAGGRMRDGVLSCCVFDHFMLEREDTARLDHPDSPDGPDGYGKVEALFRSCGIALEHPHDMLEWTWLHMAVNAGVVSVAGVYGDTNDTAAAAEKMMGSSTILAHVVKAVREASRIVEARGVELRRYRGDLLPYRLPAVVSAPMMRRMFSRNVLTRRIMTLHTNMADLLAVCRDVYEYGRRSGVSAPVFYEAYETTLAKVRQAPSAPPTSAEPPRGAWSS